MSEILGAVFALIAAILFGVSIAIQKDSMNNLSGFSFSSLVRSREWIMSLLVGGMAILAYLGAMALAPLSTVQPIASVSIIVPLLAGMAIFREDVGKKKKFLLTMLLAGVVIVSTG